MPNDTTKSAPDERAELKPCPFCGGRRLSGARNETGSMVTVCDTCEAMGPSQVGTSLAAICDAWNTRTPPQVKPLVWADTDDYGQKSDDYPWCECQTIIGDYAVGKHPDASFWAWYDPEDGPIGDSHACLSAAKAAAQADYTRRILDALA